MLLLTVTLILLLLAQCLLAGAAKEVQLAMTMMIRDEAVNLRSNLPLWISIVDYFVFLVDVRTTDDSKQAIEDILNDKVKGYQIIGKNITHREHLLLHDIDS